MALRPAADELKVFRYVTNCDKEYAPVYRAIVQIFFDAKQRYVIELDRGDVLKQMHQLGYGETIPGLHEVEQRLRQLVDWGNLSATFDTTEVRRLEDFYCRRQIYSLTTAGEAAHRAVLHVEATIGKSGSLQKTMLTRIRDVLWSLVEESQRALLNAATIYSLLHDLRTAFDMLTEEANYFLTQLRDQTEKAEQAREESFLRYKRALIEYIGSFVEELRRIAGSIIQAIIVLEKREGDRVSDLFASAAQAAELPPDPDGGSPLAGWIADQQVRWAGIRSWFIGDAGDATVDRLAARACEAVVKLTRVLARLDERKIQRLDRAADFRCLARWFATCPDAASAHHLFHQAFGLYPARHFHLAQDDIERHSSHTSWWKADPVSIPRRLRTHGSISNAGRPAPAEDYSSNRRWLAEKQRRERERVAKVYQRFLHRPFRLSQLPLLSDAEFAVLLDWLAEMFAVYHGKDRWWKVYTADGLHVIEVTQQHPLTEVVIRTPGGEIHCHDYLVEITDAAEIAAEPQMANAS